MMARLAAILLAVAALFAAPALAVMPDERLADPAMEERARVISKDLRCMVCQNQSIDDSDAPLAKDLRVIVRERLMAGDSNREVIDFVVARYGEFVLLRPRMNLNTVALWASPLVLVLGGIALIAIRRRRAESLATIATGLTPEEEAQLAEVLRQTQPKS
ncbi:MAG: cytochrome c-type biogenesis protein CcmH [Rhizobiaceae bacterium]|jgi:cytochrome c-type biogenesis protein CcmH|nr:cytochrome c-type biogenesis protein CcmH [Rhizobiaceae bacterium]